MKKFLRWKIVLILDMVWMASPLLSAQPDSSIVPAPGPRYKVTGINMDISRKNTELYYGQYGDPIWISGGIRISF